MSSYGPLGSSRNNTTSSDPTRSPGSKSSASGGARKWRIVGIQAIRGKSLSLAAAPHSQGSPTPSRFPGDAQCFDVYPEEDATRDEYTDDLRRKYDEYFQDF